MEGADRHRRAPRLSAEAFLTPEWGGACGRACQPVGQAACDFPSQRLGHAVADAPAIPRWEGQPQLCRLQAGLLRAAAVACFTGVNGTVVYTEGQLIGYRWFMTANITPQFAFGHGLSYTTFAFSALEVDAQQAPDAVVARCTITNTGTLAGAEVAQAYLAFPATAEKPPLVLVGFDKVFLAPGASAQATVTLGFAEHAVWNTAQRQWQVLPGTYTLAMGPASDQLPLRTSYSVA